MQRIEIDILERLTVEARNARNPPIEYPIAEDGKPCVHRPKPDLDMADLLDAAIAEIKALRARQDHDPR